MKVKLICGPAGSGKSRYVKEHKSRDDIVIDIDALYHAITYLPYYDKPKDLLLYVDTAKVAIYKQIEKDNSNRTAWIVTSGAELKTREVFKDRFDAEVIILESPLEKCMENIIYDQSRNVMAESDWKKIVKGWWDRYEK